MTDPAVQRQDYYVYALFREDGQTPFYIGKGRGRRMKIHETEAARGTSHKDRIIQKMITAGQRIPAAKLATNLADAMAKQIECDLIALIGRYPSGPLANLTKGGDGVSALPPDSKARQIAATINAWKDSEKRHQRIRSLQSVWTPEKREEHSRQAKERYASRPKRIKPAKPPSRRDQRSIMERFWSDPIKRRKVIEARRQAQECRPPLSEEQRRVMGARLNSPQALAKRAATNVIPEIKAKRIAAQRAAFRTHEAKAKRSETSKEVWARKKAQK